MSKDIIAKACEIVKKQSVMGGEYTGQYCILTLIDAEGFPTSSVITASKSDDIKWVTFCTLLNSNKVKEIKNCSRASVCFAGIDHSVNLVGEIEIITSEDVKQEMWYDALKMHSPEGYTDPSYCVLKFTAKRYTLFVNGEYIAGTI